MKYTLTTPTEKKKRKKKKVFTKIIVEISRVKTVKSGTSLFKQRRKMRCKNTRTLIRDKKEESQLYCN